MTPPILMGAPGRIAFAALAVVYTAGCRHEGPPKTPSTTAMSPQAQGGEMVTLPLGGRVLVRPGQDGQVVVLPFGTVQKKAIWETREIPVCWENPSNDDEVYRDLVKKSVTETWQQNSKLQFNGWGPCATDPFGIRILISDEPPHTEALGRYLDHRPHGMMLNVQFAKWSVGCRTRKDFCLWAIAVHEFGHAIGFAHENNRADRRFECKRDPESGIGDWNIGDYDASSVMNYCNKDWNNKGRLSDRDLNAVRTIYGTP